jgi:circadian clock protein KaiB
VTGTVEAPWALTLYVNGASPQSIRAIETVRGLCNELGNQVDLEVIDVHLHPALVERDEIVALPTLIRRRPVPPRRLVGDLADLERVRFGLHLGPLEPVGPAGQGE